MGTAEQTIKFEDDCVIFSLIQIYSTVICVICFSNQSQSFVDYNYKRVSQLYHNKSVSVSFPFVVLLSGAWF